MDKGLMCSIFRWSHDCTNNGVTGNANGYQDAILIDDKRIASDDFAIFEPSARSPALYLRAWKGRMIAVPEPIPATMDGEALGLKGWMMGGNFIYTSDSRFPADAPIRVYDRRED